MRIARGRRADAASDQCRERAAGHRRGGRRRLGGQRAVPELTRITSPPSTRTPSTSGTDRPRSPCTTARCGWPRGTPRPCPDRPGHRGHGAGRPRAPSAGWPSPTAGLWIATGAFPATSHSGGTLRVAAALLPGHFTGVDPVRDYDRRRPATRVIYDGLLAYHYSGVDPQVLVPDLATSVPEPTDGERPTPSTSGPASATPPARGPGLRPGPRRAASPAPRRRPDFYAGIVGGRACIATPSSCDLSRGVDADDAAGRITFHLVAPDPQFLYKLTLLVVPTPPGTPRDGSSPLARHRPLPHLVVRRAGPDPRSEPVLPAVVGRGSTGRLPRPHQVGQGCRRPGRRRRGAPRPADLAELTPLGVLGPPAGPLVDALRLTAPSQLRHTVLQAIDFARPELGPTALQRRRARQAFNYAVDRRKFVALLGGPSVARPTCQLMPPEHAVLPALLPLQPGPTGRHLPRPRTSSAPAPRAAVRHARRRGDRRRRGRRLQRPRGGVLRACPPNAGLPRHPAPTRDTHKNGDWFYDPHSGIQVEAGGWLADFPLPRTSTRCSPAPPGGGYPFNYCNRRPRPAVRRRDPLLSRPVPAPRSAPGQHRPRGHRPAPLVPRQPRRLVVCLAAGR